MVIIHFAIMYLIGTAAEDESDFSSAKTLLYNPEGYNISYRIMFMIKQ